MSQVTDYVISGTPLTMTQLASELEAMFAATASENRGATAPSNPFEGMLWQDSATTPTEYLKKYTATFGWVTLASINITTGAYIPYRSGTALGDASTKTVGVAIGNVQQVDQAVTATTRSATTTLGTSLNHTLSDTSTTITAFNGVAGVIYHCRVLGAGSITHHATNLIITQTGASITTVADDTFDVEMITTTTCRIKNYQRASGASLTAVASQAEMEAGTESALRGVSPLLVAQAISALGGSLTLGTPQASTSGTAINFTGIPAGTKRVTICLNQVSLSGSDDIVIQLGDSGGFETSGYTGGTAVVAGSYAGAVGVEALTTGFRVGIVQGDENNPYNGNIIFTLMNSTNHTFSASGVVFDSAGRGYWAACTKSLSAELTQLRITTDGSNTFDAGEINIVYE